MKLKFWPISWLKLLSLFFIATGLLIVLTFIDRVSQEPVNLWTKNDFPHLDCGVVLTGAPGRIREGFELLQQKKIKKLIISGVYKEATFQEIFPYWPYYDQVSSDDVILEKRSQTTLGNAHQTLALIETLKCQDIYLITSQLHMSRAYSIFKEVYPPFIYIEKLTLPNSKTEQTTFGLSLEVIKSIFYTVFSLAS
ncbi:MAG: YdcF family protein [Pseudobdellovibrio sp.]